MREAQALAVQGINVDLVAKLKGELVGLIAKEEQMWQQRSKIHWLKSIDKNSKFFYSKATQRFRRNRIIGLEDPNGVWCVGDENVAGMLEDYYSKLFTTSNLSNFDEVTQHVGQIVAEEMNKDLIGDFNRRGVERALNQMAPLKALGSDGMPPIFYQHYWKNISANVTNEVLFCLNIGKIPSSLNHTYLTLIPKVKCLVKVMDFRPIALCNVLYKIISKVLANRLKKILPCIISKFQSAFQTNKVISDNILVAFESLHHMKKKKKKRKKGKNGCMAMKLDMSKAYDKVEQSFLMKIMERMGFHSRWRG